MTTGLDKFKKKWGSSIERTKKEGRKAAEGHLLKEIADKKKANEGFFDKAEKYIKENNIVVPEDEQYTIMTVSFLNKMEQDMKERITAELKSNMEKDEEEMNAEQIKAIVAEAVAAMTENKTKELELQVRLQEARNQEIEMKLALATAELKLRVMHMQEGIEYDNPMEGKLEEVEAIEQVEEQFVPKKVRKGKLKGKVEEVVEHPHLGLSTPLRKGKNGLSIDWKAVEVSGLFETVVVDIVLSAVDRVDVSNGKEFKSLGGVYNGAYQQFMLRNKGTKGAWKAFIEQQVNVQA